MLDDIVAQSILRFGVGNESRIKSGRRKDDDTEDDYDIGL